MISLSSRHRTTLWLSLAAFSFCWISSTWIRSTLGQERERLTEPVFRVENNADTAPDASSTKVAATEKKDIEEAAVQSQSAQSSPLAANVVAEPTHPLAAPAKPLAEPVKESVAVASNAPLPKSVPPPAPKELTPRETLDLAVRDAKLALLNINNNVRGYSCDFIKRERIDGELSPVEQIKLKVRNEHRAGNKMVPFSVYMKFIGPRECRNREILYVQGENNNKLLAKEGGTRGKWLPSVWLPIDCSFAMKSSRYPITQVGIKRLTERLIESAAENTTINLCKVKYVQGAKVDGRNCSYLEVIRPERQPGELGPNNIYLAQVFIDTELQIPLRYAAYDWPSRPGGRPKVVEEYTYRNIRLNPGLGPEDFHKDNPEYNF